MLIKAGFVQILFILVTKEPFNLSSSL